jgi:hypothetical protein
MWILGEETAPELELVPVTPRQATAEKAPASHDRVEDGADAACRGGADGGSE